MERLPKFSLWSYLWWLGLPLIMAVGEMAVISWRSDYRLIGWGMSGLTLLLFTAMGFWVKKRVSEAQSQEIEVGLSETRKNLQEQTVTLVRNALSIVEYRNKLEDRNAELLGAKNNLERQNITLIKNARELEQYQTQLVARNRQLLEALEKTQQLSQSLVSEKQQMEILLLSLTDGVFAVNQDNHVLLFNKAAEQITGISKDQVLGQSVDEVMKFYKGDEQIRLAAYSQQDEKVMMDLRREGLTMKTGNDVLFMSLAVSPVLFAEPGRTGWIVTFSDITKEKQLEAMKLDFVSMAAHELRTPLTTIKGYISMLQQPDSMEKFNEMEKEIVSKALMSALRLDKLIENLLAVSRIEKNEIPLSKENIQLTELAQRSVNELEGLAKDKSLSLQFVSPEEELPLVMADASRMGEVFSNLIGNAINYTDKGEVKVRVYLDGDQLVTEVADTGKGIPKEAIPHLFTKFFRVKSDLVENQTKGTGLGLYISKNIIEVHGGKIWVESKLGEGTTFYFSLPAVGSK